MKKEHLKLREKLLFKTPVKQFEAATESYRQDFKQEYNQASDAKKQELASILTEITIDLQSYLTRWNLQRSGDDNALTIEQIDTEADKNYKLLFALGYTEQVEKAKQEVVSIRSSNLVKMSQMADNGMLNNRWGNDYASGLTASLRRGGIMVTTNPQLINVARKESPEHWDKVRDRLKEKNSDKTPEELATLLTMEVVLENCREIRPIYDITNGELGYVSLQVNPKNYTDADGMVKEAGFLYNEVSKELGGTPNMVFKVPATRAALEAVKRLTKKGIGVNVTVNFTVGQEVAFAEAIEEGNAKVSVLTIMSGRLDDPIRDELKSMGVEGVEDAATWAGIAVARKCYDILYRQRKYKKSALLQASLRGSWHIDRLLTDEDIIIYFTIFPDKAEQYDSEQRDLSPQLKEEIPGQVMEVLNKSEIFRKAFDEKALTADEFDAYYPVTVTLEAFGKAYDDFVDYLR